MKTIRIEISSNDEVLKAVADKMFKDIMTVIVEQPPKPKAQKTPRTQKPAEPKGIIG